MIRTCLRDFSLCGFVYVVLLTLVMSSSAYAVTIVDVQEIMTVISRDDISNCEWIETTEVRKITTYREPYTTNIATDIPGVPLYLEFLDPSLYTNQGVVGNGQPGGNPCYSESNNDGKISDACTDQFTLIGLGYAVTSSFQLFREWSDVTISYVMHHYNECHTCNHDPVPEPGSIVLVTTGTLLLFFIARKRQLKS